VGILIGIPMSSFMITGINMMLDTNMMSMPSNLSVSAYISAVFGCMLAIILSNFSAKRKIQKFDMVEVLKEKE
jgi:putative ABC transport system permease protein